MKYLTLVLLALPLCAQTQLPRVVLPQLREYLQLTNTQVSGIGLNNDEYNKSVAERQTRIWQVQFEIAGETTKDPLDPAALGVRYVEIELICRDLRDLANNLKKQNLALLTDEQRTKLKALEEAMKLVPIATEAQNVNLLGNWSTAPDYTSIAGAFLSLPNAAVNPANSCPGTASRSGILVPIIVP